MKFALAATVVAASAPAAAADYYLKFGPVKSASVNGKIREAAARAVTGKRVEVMSWSWGASRRIAAADYDGDGRADRSVKPRDSASGLATGKRQHKPREPGSVNVVGKFPACIVGAAYDDALLRVASMSYKLKDVTITSCTGAPGSGGVPTQGLSFTFDRIASE